MTRSHRILAGAVLAAALVVAGGTSAVAENHSPVSPADNHLTFTPADNNFPVSPADNHLTVTPADNQFPVSPADNHLTVTPADNHINGDDAATLTASALALKPSDTYITDTPAIIG
ncbi:hypothetical protein [Streptomyces sp. RFCAC02]|uniref:hypothetical protein n=1 Tax=Streptomyces sp. RFCAC02 TaxID=2499143 RepID=UPI00101F94C2|nr:hypothetical protein [Streptomyces sp. RFCAC02]